MKQVVLITGANGMLARKLSEELKRDYSIRYLTRKVNRSDEYLWDLQNDYIDPEALKGVHHILHLAGSSIADKRWTKIRKQAILSSRVDSADLIRKELEKHQITIDTFLSASAIGYYGATTSDDIFNEESPKGNDFLSDVCFKWENAAYAFESKNIARRVVILRIGIILAKEGGVLKKISQPIKYGFGSGIGKGDQYMPWIHIKDLCGIFKFIIKEPGIRGIFNAVSPEHITNMELTKRIAKILKRKIILPNIPEFVIKGLFGEMSEILLKGSRVSSDKIVKKGYVFKYKEIEDALNNIFNKL